MREYEEYGFVKALPVCCHENRRSVMIEYWYTYMFMHLLFHSLT